MSVDLFKWIRPTNKRMAVTYLGVGILFFVIIFPALEATITLAVLQQYIVLYALFVFLVFTIFRLGLKHLYDGCAI